MTARDDGLAAGARGDYAEVIRLLEPLAAEAPDYEVASHLGMAYARAGRHTEAVATLTRAVQIEPANAQARYNLGVAMEHGGWPTQALEAYRQALMIRPDYAQASEAATRLAAAPQSPPAPVAPPVAAPVGLAGGMSASSMQAPGATPPAVAPQVATMPPIDVPPADRFDLVQACRNFGAVLVAPRALFRRQRGRQGYKEAFAGVVVYALGYALLMGLVNAVSNRSPGGPAILALGLVVFGTLVWRLFAWLFHKFSGMFGGAGTVDSCFHVVVWTALPLSLVSFVSGFIGGALGLAPAQKGPPSGATALFNGIIALVSAAVGAIYCTIGLQEVEDISAGAAFGAWFLTMLCTVGVVVALIVLVAVIGAHG